MITKVVDLAGGQSHVLFNRTSDLVATDRGVFVFPTLCAAAYRFEWGDWSHMERLPNSSSRPFSWDEFQEPFVSPSETWMAGVIDGRATLFRYPEMDPVLEVSSRRAIFAFSPNETEFAILNLEDYYSTLATYHLSPTEQPRLMSARIDTFEPNSFRRFGAGLAWGPAGIAMSLGREFQLLPEPRALETSRAGGRLPETETVNGNALRWSPQGDRVIVTITNYSAYQNYTYRLFDSSLRMLQEGKGSMNNAAFDAARPQGTALHVCDSPVYPYTLASNPPSPPGHPRGPTSTTSVPAPDPLLLLGVLAMAFGRRKIRG